MSKHWKPAKKSVELRPSRIRRDPVPLADAPDSDEGVRWSSDEREIWLAMIGIVAFALAINILTYGISEITM